MKFTQGNVTKIKPPQGKADHWESDDTMPGFGVRFRNGGDGVYGVRYSLAGRDRRLSFDKVSRVTLADAKIWAREQFTAVAKRIDPAVARARTVAKSANTIEPLIDNFLEYLRANGRASTYLSENTRSLKKYFRALHPYAAADISRAMVAKELARIRIESGPIAADRSRSHLSKFFGWLIGEGLAEVNPVLGTNRVGGNKPRERILSDTEIKSIWSALGDDDHGDICRLLIVTGARRVEIGALSFSEIRNNQIELPGSRTKNGRDFVIPLPPLAQSILAKRNRRNGSDYLFGRKEGGFVNWSGAKALLDGRLNGIAHWTLHDFRRFVSTTMHERLNIQPHIVEAVLNHVSGAKSGIAGVYNKAQYIDQKRDALTRYADYVARIVGAAQ
jgi:integrase